MFRTAEDRVALVAQIPDYVRTDESRRSGDEDPHAQPQSIAIIGLAALHESKSLPTQFLLAVAVVSPVKLGLADFPTFSHLRGPIPAERETEKEG
jgi:hypothetical protein